MVERPARFQIERPVEFRFADMRGAPPLQGRTVNISSGGVLFRTDQTVGVGRKIDMIVRMFQTDSDELKVDLRLFGRVIRSGPGWAAIQVKKHQIRPTSPPDTPPGNHNSPGKSDGL